MESKYTIYSITDKSTMHMEIFFTRAELRKSLNGFKRFGKRERLKQIIISNNYTVEILQIYESITRTRIETELIFWEKHREDIIIRRNQAKIQAYTNTHITTRDKSLTFGLGREKVIIPIMNSFFDTGANEIVKTTYKFSLFDCHDNKKYLYEIKSLTYPINKYSSAVMNVDKIIHDHMIFVFEYANGEKRDLYFHIYDSIRIYNKRFITPLNRINTCEIIDIPVNELIPIDIKNKYILNMEASQADTEILNELIRKDLLYKK
jgi:hypothetical protein